MELAIDLCPTFLNTGATDKTYQQPRKKDSFRHILESSASKSECSGSHFFRATTEIQSGQDAFDESKLVMTFLTNLGIM